MLSKKVNYILKYFCQRTLWLWPHQLSLSLSFWVLFLRSAPMSRHCKDTTPSATSILNVFPFCSVQNPLYVLFLHLANSNSFPQGSAIEALALRLRTAGKSSFHDSMFFFEAATTCTRLAATCADVFKLSNVSFWGRYWKETLSKLLQDWYDAKVVLVGDATVGKTHLLSRYVKGAFPAFSLLVSIWSFFWRFCSFLRCVHEMELVKQKNTTCAKPNYCNEGIWLLSFINHCEVPSASGTLPKAPTATIGVEFATRWGNSVDTL